MDRREMLTRSGALVGAVSLGGCLSRVRNVGEQAGETTDGRETTRATQPNLTDTSFELTGGGCGQRTSEATVRFREADSGVTVTGTIPGPNACYTAKLANVNYDPETGTLVVTVTSTQKEGADICAQCIVEIQYEARFAFEGGLPERVKVVHEAMGESETVATAGSG